MSVINLQNIRQAEGLMDSLHDVRTKIEQRINLEKYTANQWKRIVPDMAKKANLDSNQEATILRYVLEAAKP
jgi:flagellar biosynthesis regulator FlaF